MAHNDFITALGRLLRDGNLRDSLAANAQATASQLSTCERDILSLSQLVPEDLEYQASVLLRKRLDLIRPVLADTCHGLGSQAWPAFYQYARVSWPSGVDAIYRDAVGFVEHLQGLGIHKISEMERNQVRFAVGQKKFEVHLIRRMNGKRALQLLIKSAGGNRHQFLIYFKF
jgi:hypothetical protein